jgi:hypothetical protein
MVPGSSGRGFNRGISSSIKLLEISLPGLEPRSRPPNPQPSNSRFKRVE